MALGLALRLSCLVREREGDRVWHGRQSCCQGLYSVNLDTQQSSSSHLEQRTGIRGVAALSCAQGSRARLIACRSLWMMLAMALFSTRTGDVAPGDIDLLPILLPW